MKVVFIGAGRVATHLALAFYKSSFEIIQVYSRTIESASELASKLNCRFTNRINEIDSNADMYIFSVKDSAFPELLGQIPNNNGFWIHTAGSLSIDIFSPYSKKYGVMYPLQTFSKDRYLDFSQIPFFIEANNLENLRILQDIGRHFTNHIYELSSDKRQYLHLTGVFACNFVNHMYTISKSILENAGLDFKLLLPLIDETVSKVHEMSPEEAQTGPAVRFDTNIIQKHVSLLKDHDLKEIYNLLSNHIYKTYNKHEYD